MKEKLLYLCHRIPYPPNKGDKIAAYNILKFLNQHFDVYLGCFIDNPEDNQYQEYVRSLCKEACFVPLNPNLAKLKGISAFASGLPITVPHYGSRTLQKWVNQTVNSLSLDKVFVFSSCMAQFVLNRDSAGTLHHVMHFVDIDSDKWRQYAEKTHGVMRWIYQREHHTLEKYEKYLAKQFNTSCFVTDAETAMFKNMVEAPYKDRIKTLGNGIDTNYFSPSAKHELAEKYPLELQNYIVFTGAMDYWANVDAVVWFAENIWPSIRKLVPNSYFYIVGSSPTKQVQKLDSIAGIIITGRVEDVRPYLHHAKASVAPMQIARGVQNKILEAMSMECPVTATTLGIEGIDGIEIIPDSYLYISDSAENITQWLTDKLNHENKSAQVSRNWLKENYSWSARLSPLLHYLDSSLE
ncbi:TIGR03087 family PEP-CTERM/XrtA system glycosyltransferase [Vibrio algarum]|uniref:TIGR03087 family PEP-CTERM/XrtA system glycosyltransferase n=1 Tax=Vibrio algarum TaxID=3020714 RepID=A0ABT4YQ94_9VIBR|nr:TIGR03087 family PEP-CTERM/XrtA system glycosyltransferase [Vibrio sp. KJ40-1]MDB1123724.1 TIGR03087 family PEP-CTERM/XrtA system glycosyltransferase [Vibrio sp. KJ40-1]